MYIDSSIIAQELEINISVFENIKGTRQLYGWTTAAPTLRDDETTVGRATRTSPRRRGLNYRYELTIKPAKKVKGRRAIKRVTRQTTLSIPLGAFHPNTAYEASYKVIFFKGKRQKKIGTTRRSPIQEFTIE